MPSRCRVSFRGLHPETDAGWSRELVLANHLEVQFALHDMSPIHWLLSQATDLGRLLHLW